MHRGHSCCSSPLWFNTDIVTMNPFSQHNSNHLSNHLKKKRKKRKRSESVLNVCSPNSSIWVNGFVFVLVRRACTRVPLRVFNETVLTFSGGLSNVKCVKHRSPHRHLSKNGVPSCHERVSTGPPRPNSDRPPIRGAVGLRWRVCAVEKCSRNKTNLLVAG